ncbi:MAG: hypothetical protein KatS3mg129_0793 [Leptospiraceae bacterium]|nr:MAG: hypothetical protein KatS3mg129_0793 [Leptospiraceae bacterium]
MDTNIKLNKKQTDYLLYYFKKNKEYKKYLPLLKRSKIWNEFINGEIPLYYIESIINCLESGISVKYLKKILKHLRKHNFPELLIYQNLNNSKLFIKEGNIVIEPETSQYILNFYSNEIHNKEKKEILNPEVISLKDIYKIIIDNYNKKNYTKVYEYSYHIIKLQKYNKIFLFNSEEMFKFYEIYATAILNLKSAKESFRIFKTLFKELNEPYFLKQLGIQLFLSKHFKFSLKFFYRYYRYIRQKNIDSLKLNEEEIKIKSIIKINKIMLFMNDKNDKAKLKLIK